MQETQEMWVWTLGRKDPLEEETAAHSSILAWRIPWIEEPGELKSLGSHRVRHNWVPEHVLEHQKHVRVPLGAGEASGWHQTADLALNTHPESLLWLTILILYKTPWGTRTSHGPLGASVSSSAIWGYTTPPPDLTVITATKFHCSLSLFELDFPHSLSEILFYDPFSEGTGQKKI